MGRQAKANVIAAIILLGFVAAVAFHYVKGVYQGLPYPHNTFLFRPLDRFGDYYALLEWNQDLNPYLQGSATSQYPLLNLVSYALSTLDPDWSLAVFHGVVITALLWLNGKALVQAGRAQTYLNTAVITLLAYPFLFTIDRGNFESLLCVFLLLFSWFYQRGQYRSAAFCLAFPIAMKLFPAVLLVLFVSDRRYKEALQAVLWAALLTLLSLATFEGGFYQNLMVVVSGRNLTTNYNFAEFTGGNEKVQRGVALFSVMKILLVAAGKIEGMDMSRTLHVYIVSMAFISLLVVLYVVFVETRLWKRVALLTFMMLMFPQISAEYKLMHVLLPLLLFVRSSTHSQWDWVYAAFFGLLMIAKDYVILDWVRSDGEANDISINMLVNPALMMAMMGLIIVTGLRDLSGARLRSLGAAHWRAIASFVWPFRRRVDIV